METINANADCAATADKILADLPHETCAVVVFTEREQAEPWALVEIRPVTDSRRSVFPLYSDALRGDTERRLGHRGILVHAGASRHAYGIVVERSARMIRSERL